MQETPTTYEWRSYNKDFYNFISVIGKGAPNKNIPSEWLDMPAGLVEQLLLGIVDGDGHVTNKGLTIVRSTSRALVYAIQQMVLKVYNIGAKVYKVRDAGKMNILGRICNTHDVYDVKWHAEQKRSNMLIKDNQLLLPVKTITHSTNDTVYSLTVWKDASYTVQNAIVKNCGYLGENFWNEGKTKEI